MTFDEYIEKTFPPPFNNIQKNHKFKYAETERKIGLKEHRCTCGRLLGRFNGQAEIKCPKCGKMNVIGGKAEGEENLQRTQNWKNYGAD